jgi:hypothetical protein
MVQVTSHYKHTSSADSSYLADIEKEFTILVKNLADKGLSVKKSLHSRPRSLTGEFLFEIIDNSVMQAGYGKNIFVSKIDFDVINDEGKIVDDKTKLAYLKAVNRKIDEDSSAITKKSIVEPLLNGLKMLANFIDRKTYGFGKIFTVPALKPFELINDFLKFINNQSKNLPDITASDVELELKEMKSKKGGSPTSLSKQTSITKPQEITKTKKPRQEGFIKGLKNLFKSEPPPAVQMAEFEFSDEPSNLIRTISEHEFSCHEQQTIFSKEFDAEKNKLSIYSTINGELLFYVKGDKEKHEELNRNKLYIINDMVFSAEGFSVVDEKHFLVYSENKEISKFHVDPPSPNSREYVLEYDGKFYRKYTIPSENVWTPAKTFLVEIKAETLDQANQKVKEEADQVDRYINGFTVYKSGHPLLSSKNKIISTFGDNSSPTKPKKYVLDHEEVHNGVHKVVFYRKFTVRQKESEPAKTFLVKMDETTEDEANNKVKSELEQNSTRVHSGRFGLFDSIPSGPPISGNFNGQYVWEQGTNSLTSLPLQQRANSLTSLPSQPRTNSLTSLPLQPRANSLTSLPSQPSFYTDRHPSIANNQRRIGSFPDPSRIGSRGNIGGNTLGAQR